MVDIDSDPEDYVSASDEELQEAFASGLLKPGINTVHVVEKKTQINNVADLKRKLAEIKQPLGFVERLDVINGLAPLAPELAVKLGEHERIRENQLRNAKKGTTTADIDKDPVVNDFRREMAFYRQAQAAVVAAMPRLKELKLPTKRPDDYFAQMAKTDDHMQKVREVLKRKQTAEALSERAKRLRQQRKMSKQIQIETKLRREAEKKQLSDEVKKYRKGLRNDLDFLDDRKAATAGKTGKKKGKKVPAKRALRDQKFGFGGKKRGKKTNTRESYAEMGVGGGKQGRRPAPGKGKGKKAAGKMRPGKSKRMAAKGKRK